MILTEKSLIFIGTEQEKTGPNKGKLVKAIKRKIPFSGIGGVSLRYVFVYYTSLNL
jgi:myosin I